MGTCKTRREYGTGSVFQRADGRWAATIEAGYTASGSRRRVTVTSKGCVGGCSAKCAHRAEIKAKLKERQRQIAAEGLPTVSARATVKSWSDSWLEMTRLTLRPRPWATNRSAVRQWIVPTIGHRRLDQLAPADIRAVAEAQRAAGRSSSTAQRTHVTLTGMLRAAILEGHQVPRRVLDVAAPAKAVNDRTSMTVVESVAVLHAASFLPHGSRWAIAVFGGMRQGECLGLLWENVDLDAGTITVQWELQQVPYIDRNDKSLGFRLPEGLPNRHLVDSFHLLPPKTKRGFRVVPLVPAMVEALRDWKEIAPPNPYGLVWPTAGGRPANEKHDREEWQALQGTACVGHPGGRYYHPHEARHTTATAMLEAGVDPKIVTDLLGHSSILTSNLYQHTSQSQALLAMEAVAGRYSGQ
ncbi:tyrosine-type recombinase/integrase [Nocardioides campestrisoli]|uniref:tyrosine-type recombinase/integrase n=1 Tax=Nocardioides campestrisoli TaxID=2736757 RepID=UPI0015E7B07B|nr:site-specific integrase [Nocardioides campestrisoli]